MSGALVPYHQRQNKAVDRHLFIDLLTKVNRYVPIAEYKYVSFGGAFLEDFKLIHSHFGNNDLISLENNSIAYERQKFNVPLSCIKCLHQDSSEFIDNYQGDTPSIFWLDYADANKTRIQIQEFETLVSKLLENDVVKITINANPDSLYSSNGGNSPETKEQKANNRLVKLLERIGDYLPNDITVEDMSMDGLPRVMIKAIEYAANKGMQGKLKAGLYFQPLSAFAYNDSHHQMLTVSGMILSKSLKKDFFRKTGIKNWKPKTLNWGEYKNIMMPALTAREKVFIDQQLPIKTSRAIHKKLKFYFDSVEDKSIKIIDNYKLYYRYYPNFHRVHF